MTERASVAEKLAERLASVVVVSEEIVASPYRHDVVDVRFTDAERDLIVASLRLAGDDNRLLSAHYQDHVRALNRNRELFAAALARCEKERGTK